MMGGSGITSMDSLAEKVLDATKDYRSMVYGIDLNAKKLP